MPETVQLFVTCIIDSLYPHVGQAVVRLLERTGREVSFPTGQTCCGQPAFNAGMRVEARRIAEYTIKIFENAPGPIVLPSGSCTAMIRHGYQELFKDDPDWFRRATSLAERTYELSELLVDVLGVRNLGARFPGRLAYHASCHLLRDLGVNRQPLDLLLEVEEAELVELPNYEECCGFGGLFSVEHPEVSSAMLERKINNIDASGAEYVVSCDAGCISNINGGLHRRGKPLRAIHIAEMLVGRGMV